MIVHERPSGLTLFLIMRGSVLQRIRWKLSLNILLAVLVTFAHGYLFDIKITVTTIPFTLIGLPLAIFLGFRNNTAYDRYWEGRKLWGDLNIRARVLARQCLSLIQLPQALQAHNREGDVRVRMVHRALAHAHALRAQLRGHVDDRALERWLTHEDWERVRNLPLAYRGDAIVQANAHDLSQCVRDGLIDPCVSTKMDETLTHMTFAAASCERLRHTPIPFSYTLLLHRTAHLYCFLLPFGLVDVTGFMTPFVVGIVAYTFFGLDALGDELEEPFGTDNNDLPLDAMCRSMEMNLLQLLGDPDIPAPMQPVDHRLT
ncbi:MAG: bestrophin family protein [Comamonas sp.]